MLHVSNASNHLVSREPLVYGTARNGQASEGEKPTKIADAPPSSSVFAIVVVAVASHPLMRTQLVSTLLRARPATVSCVTPRLARASSNTHHRETFESFTERYVNLFFPIRRGTFRGRGPARD